MLIKLVNRTEPDKAIDFQDWSPVDMTITELLQTQKVAELTDCLDVIADGVVIVPALWDKFSLKDTRLLTIVIRPRGTVVSLVVMALVVAYSYVMASKAAKMAKKNTNKTSSTSSIYDPNAQGNKVKLEDPIPEQFGYVKAFPDLISEYHYYYKNNVRYMDVLLCQGVGYFDHSPDTLYIGNTPITSYDSSLYNLKIADPGVDISGHTAHNCWYQSTEVTSSGHEISPKKPGEDEQDTGSKNSTPNFSGNTMLMTVSSTRVTAVGSAGPEIVQGMTYLDCKYAPDDIIQIQNMAALADLKFMDISGFKAYADGDFAFTELANLTQTGTDVKVYLEYIPVDVASMVTAIKKIRVHAEAWSVVTPGGGQMKIPLGYVDKAVQYQFGEDGQGEYIVLKNLDLTASYTPTGGSNGVHWSFEIYAPSQNCPVMQASKQSSDATEDWYDSSVPRQLNCAVLTRTAAFSSLSVGDVITVSCERTYWYLKGYGSQGPSYTKQVFCAANLYRIVSKNNNVLYLDRDLIVPDETWYGQSYVSVSMTASAVYVTKQAAFDYPNRDGNGFYRVIENNVTEGNHHTLVVQAVDYEAFTPTDYANWVGFPFSGYYSCNVSLLSEGNSSTNGHVTTAGPYRACPRGCGARYYELDFTFPSGLYTLNDDGDYEDRTASILIEFRPAGSTGSWTQYPVSWTKATGDELGYTIAFDMFNYNGIDDPDEYWAFEFRVTNTSSYTEDNKVMQKLYWNGLKCMIANDTVYEDVTVIALSIKGSETMSEASENQVATYWTRMLPNINTGELEKTKSIVPAVKYICDQSRFDDLYVLSNWIDYHNLCEGAGIEFNYRFDDFTTILEAIRTVLQNGYTEPIVSGNEILPKRKVPTDSFVQMFSPQNMVGDVKYTTAMITEDTDNEIDLTYMDGDKGDGTWKEYQEFVELDVAENTGSKSYYQQGSNVQSMELLACTDEDSAYRIALRQLREMMYCRQEVSFKTELDALNCQYGDVVLVALPMDNSLVSGRITAWDETTNKITVDQYLDPDAVTGVIYIRRPDGSVWGGTCVYADDYSLTLTAVLDWDIQDWLDENPSLEQPYFCYGGTFKGWVKSIKPSQNTASVTVVNYSDKIFVDDIFEGYGISPYGTCKYGSK